MDKFNKLAKQAAELQPVERIRLVEEILKSLDKADPSIEEKLAAESENRYEAYKKGELKATDWTRIKKRYTR